MKRSILALKPVPQRIEILKSLVNNLKQFNCNYDFFDLCDAVIMLPSIHLCKVLNSEDIEWGSESDYKAISPQYIILKGNIPISNSELKAYIKRYMEGL